MIKEILQKLDKHKTTIDKLNSTIVQETLKGNMSDTDYEWLKVAVQQNINYLESLKNTIELGQKVNS